MSLTGRIAYSSMLPGRKEVQSDARKISGGKPRRHPFGAVPVSEVRQLLAAGFVFRKKVSALGHVPGRCPGFSRGTLLMRKKTNGKATRRKQMTNKEHLMAMPSLELAKILNNGKRCEFCSQKKSSCDCNCTQNTALWLDSIRQPADTEEISFAALEELFYDSLQEG